MAGLFCCPICQGTDLVDFRGRVNEVCGTCKSKIRHRAVFVALRALGLFDKPDRKILHFAPERCLVNKFNKVFKAGYQAFDLEPDRYKIPKIKVRPLNLCGDYSELTEEYDAIIHNHVLEHIGCDVFDAIANLDARLAPGGIHVFTIPFGGETTDEEYEAEMSPEDRKTRFLQEDHVRIFGRNDFPQKLKEHWQADQVVFPFESRFGKDDLERYGLPRGRVSKIGGASVFFHVKQ